MKITFDPTQGLIVIPSRLHGFHTDTIVRLVVNLQEGIVALGDCEH